MLKYIFIYYILTIQFDSSFRYNQEILDRFADCLKTFIEEINQRQSLPVCLIIKF